MRLYMQSGVNREIFCQHRLGAMQPVILDCDDFEINVALLAPYHSGMGAEQYADTVRETARKCVRRVRGYDADVYGGLEPEYYWALCEHCGEVLDPGYLRNVPDFIRRNIDFEGAAEELFFAGDYTAFEYGAETIIYSE